MEKRFDKLLNEELDNLDTAEIKSQYEIIRDISKDLAAAKGKVVELELQLQQAIDELNFQLGLAVRKQMPKLGVSLNNGRCNVSYRTRNLNCRPNLEEDIWELEPNDFGRRFKRIYGQRFPLSDVDKFANLIASHYRGRYKTLR